MKRLAILIVICMISFILTSCGMSRQEATEYVESMTKSDYYGFNSDLEKYVEQKNFQNAVSDVLENGTPSECFRLIDNLNEFYDGEDENLKMVFQEYLSKLKEQVFSDTADITFEKYVDLVCSYIVEYAYADISVVTNKNYYATLEECLPYEQTVEYIKSHGIKPIFENGQGGYYDDKQNDYENISKTVDPLGISDGKGGIGTMTETQKYSFYGDFLISDHKEQWYGTSSGDKGNTRNVQLYFKEEIIYSDTNPRSYLESLMSGDTYMVPCYTNNAINDYFPCVIKDNAIIFSCASLLIFNYSD